MAKIKIASNQAAKTKVLLWKNSPTTQADELIYHPSDLDGKDIQLWAYKQNILIDQTNDVGPFLKLIFVSLLTE